MSNTPISFFRSIRGRIFIGFLFPVIPLVAIVLVNYYPTRDNTLETGKRLMALSTRSCAEKINTAFTAGETLFADWTEVDLFGMAMEFHTLEELRDHFHAMLKGHPEFSLLLLTDKNGIVLQGAGGPKSPPGVIESARGIRIPETADLVKRNDRMLSLVKTDSMPAPLNGAPDTAMFSFKTRNSAGTVNGFFLAFLDPGVVGKMIEAMELEMVKNGFQRGRIGVVDGESLGVVNRSSNRFPEDELPPGVPLGRITADGSGSVTRALTDRGGEYVAAELLTPSPNLLIYDKSGTGGSRLYLTVFVTETEILSRVSRIFRAALLITLVGALIFLLICVLIAQSITHPMRELIKVLDAYGKGDDEVRADLKSRDEIGYFAREFNAMLEQIHVSALTLRNSESRYRSLFENLRKAVNERTYDYRFTPASSRDDLSLSLNRMLETLEKSDREATSRDWMKTGRTELSDLLSGERSMEELGKRAVTYTAKYVGALVGTIYVKSHEGDEYVLTANYAFRKRKGFVNRFKSGQGLCGQAALEKKRLLFTEVPDDYIRVESSLGHGPCGQILLLPLLYDDDVKGVVELGKTGEFTELEIEFLELAANIMAVSINSAVFNEKLQALLDRTKTQSEELREQQEELKSANEELQEQTVILRESKAKLQLQQEELQASNEELEEKTEMLESRKEEIEKTNTSLL